MSRTSAWFRTALVTASALALTLLPASCADQETAEPESDMNQTQAEGQIQAYVTNAADELPVDVELSSVNDPAFPRAKANQATKTARCRCAIHSGSMGHRKT